MIFKSLIIVMFLLLDTIITKSLIISIKWTIFFLRLHIVNNEFI